ncbi:gamma-glutamyltransferase family protein [bacterium LRH843]|nr:gamma-glutamyltransferase family protein [bacterium LRH843]
MYYLQGGVKLNVSFDAQTSPYPAKRNVVYGKRGMVATSQPLAAEAGLDILKKGGNAIDAAIATAACLTVVEPTSNGIGSDSFAIVWVDGELYGLNGSGAAPEALSIEALREAGYQGEMPELGVVPVTVPGTPGAWAELSRRFGKLPLTEVLAPAIDYAEHGFPLSPTLAKNWEKAFNNYSNQLKGEEFVAWFETFAPNGVAPKAGEMWSSPDHARTLRSIAETEATSFYNGELADQIDDFFRKHGGFLRKRDLASYKPEWVTPIKINYRGYDVWEIPPNGSGIVALKALNILKGFEFTEKESVDTYHKQIEAMKLALTDGMMYVADSGRMTVPVEALLSDEYAEERRKLIGEKALVPEPGTPPKGGTVYLATADGMGNMVSFIQSNYMGFGSGIVVPGTGIAMQNRGHNFSLDPIHCNALTAGKRPYHTIIPGFLTKEGEAVGPFGVMGGFMQPQGHVQVIMNSIDFSLNPQAALDAPRWRWIKDKTVEVERHLPDHIVLDLVRKGHDIKISIDGAPFGKGQIIWRDPKTGVLAGGTESRADGHIAVW